MGNVKNRQEWYTSFETTLRRHIRSILDELLSKLRSRDSNLTPNTGLPGISNPNDILSKLQSQNNNLTHDTGLPGLPGTSNPDDIKTYPIDDLMKSGRFTAFERKQEYRRRGKSPSGVIDGVYNDMYRGNDEYNDTLRDWEADA